MTPEELFDAAPDAPPIDEAEALFDAAPDAPGDVKGVETSDSAIPTPSGITNEELALRTRGPTVNLGNGRKALRSSFTTEVAPGGTAFTSDGTRTMASILDGNELKASGPTPEVRAAILDAIKSSSSAQPALARANEISRRLGVPTSQVLPNLERFEATVRAADFDADTWYRQNRILFETLGKNGALLNTAMVDPHIGPIVKGLGLVEDMTGISGATLMGFTAELAVLGPLAITDAQWSGAKNLAEGKPLFGEPTSPEEKAKRTAKQAQLDTPEAQAIKETSGVVNTALVLQQRYREARAQTSMGYAGFDLARAENSPFSTDQDVAEAAAEVQNLRAAGQKLALGEDGLLADAGEAIQGLVSSADNLIARGTAFLAAATPVATVVGLGTLAATKNPAIALEAAVAAGETVGGQAQMVGGLYQGFKAEGGSKYIELRDATTEAGQKLTPREALGGAIMYGFIASILENMGTNATVGKAAGAMQDRFKALLLKDAKFRARVASFGREWAEGAVAEGVTEGLQETAGQLTDYVAESLKDEEMQKRRAVSPEQTLTAFQGGMVAGGGMGAVSGGISLGIERITADKDAVISPRQVGLIAALSGVEAVKQAPSEYAEVVRRATEEQGAPVREFWVEGGEAQRFFQEQNKDQAQAELELGQAGGPAVVEAYRQAIATGGRMAVPLETVLSTWAQSEVGKAMLPHTATTEMGLTPTQAADPQRQKEIQEGAVKLATEQFKLLEDEEGFDAYLDDLRMQAIDGGADPRAAADMEKTLRVALDTYRLDHPGKSYKDMLKAGGFFEYNEGDEITVDGKERVQALDAFTDLRNIIDFGENDGPLSPGAQASLIFTDDVTNLRNGEEAFDRVPTPAGMQVAVLTTADAKAINDHPDGSHNSTNALMKRIAAVVAKTDPAAARGGTNFMLHVRDQAALDALLEQVRVSLPVGITVDGGLGATRQAAAKAMDEAIEKKRKAGALPKRGGTNFKLEQLKGLDFAAGVALPTPSLAKQHLEAVEAEGAYDTREKFGNRAFLDRDIPGLLSRLGFMRSKPAKFTAAADLRGIRDTNIEMGKRAGDALIRIFGERLVLLGGQAFAAGHLSGDEYAMKSGSKAALLELLSDLRDELDETPVKIDAYITPVKSLADVEALAGTLGTKSKGALIINGEESVFEGAEALVALVQSLAGGSVDAKVRIDAHSLPKVQFRFGIAEGDYGAADRDLNTRKRDEAAGAPRDDAGGSVEGRPARDDLRARRSSLEERRARALQRGAPKANPFVDVAQAADDGSGAFGDSETSRGVALADPEVLATARAAVSRMRTATPEQRARVARYTAFLNYLDGSAPRPKSASDESAGLKRDEQNHMLREFGLDDPNGTFATQRTLGGIDEGLRRAKKKKTGTANPNQAEETRLKLLRGEKLFYQESNQAIVPPLKLSNGRQLIDLGTAGNYGYAESWVAVSSLGEPKADRNLAFARNQMLLARENVDRVLRSVTKGGFQLRAPELVQTASAEFNAGRLYAAWVAMNTWVGTSREVFLEGMSEDDFNANSQLRQEGVWARNAIQDVIEQAELLTGKQFQATDQFQMLELATLKSNPELAAVPAEDAQSIQVWADEYEAETGRLYQESNKGQGTVTAPAVKPFVSNAQRRYMYATNRELAEKMRAITPPGPLPESLGEAKAKPAAPLTKQEKQARKEAADVAADAILRGEKVLVPRTGNKPTIREVALALQRRQREKAGVIRDFSPESMERIAEWMATEAAYEYEQERASTSGAGWYSEKFQQAMDLLAEAFPRLNEPGNRMLMTAIIAITSDGQKVQQNLEMAIEVWRGYEADNTLTGKSWRKATAKKLRVLERLTKEMGVEPAVEFLLKEMRVADLKKLLASKKKKFSSGFGANEKVPAAAGIFGPKLGVFFANLMGRSGYLTMDRWWNRTFSRYRGTIVPEPTRAGLERFKMLLGDETMDDDEALLYAAFEKQSYEEKEYKNGTELEKAANTIAKAAFLELNDRPGGATARKFMTDTAELAVKKLKDRGIDLTVADLQAVLWYFEKRVYTTLGSKDSAETNYEDAAAKLILEGKLTRQERARPEGRAVSGAGRAERGRPAGRGEAGSRFERLEARAVPAEREQPAAVGERFSRIEPAEDGSPAGHAGKVTRYFQEEARTTPNVAREKLSDGRSIIFDTTGDDTRVAAVDLEKLQSAVDGLKKTWRKQRATLVEDASSFMRDELDGEWLRMVEPLDAAVGHLRAGRLDEADQALRDALWIEMEAIVLREMRGADDDLYQDALEEMASQEPSEWGSTLHPFLVQLEERTSMTSARTNGEFQVDAETLKSLNLDPAMSPEDRQAALKVAGRAFGGSGGNLGLSPADQQTLEVAIDEFESQTGRLYQEENLAAPLTLSDGRKVYDVGATEFGETFFTNRSTGDSDTTVVLVTKGTPLENRSHPKFMPRQASHFARDLGYARSRLRNDAANADAGLTEEQGATLLAMLEAGDTSAALQLALQLEENGANIDILVDDVARAEARRMSMLSGKDALLVVPLSAVRNSPEAIAPADADALQVWGDQLESETGRMRQNEEDDVPKGYFEVERIPGADGTRIALKAFLNKKADQSTVFHELSHGFLEFLGNLAEQPDAGPRTKQQWADTLKALGVTKRSEIKRKHHEYWADNFELYLKRGQAPSRELWGVFNRMAQWLKRIYRNVKKMQVEVDPNLARIFDRMLATDAEIARANGLRGQPVWQNAQEAGMTDAQWADYQAQQQEAQSFATRDAMLEHTKVALREAERSWKETVEAAAPEAEAEYEAMPGRRAQVYIDGQRKDLLDAGLPMAPITLRRSDVEAAVGLSAARRFRTRVNGMLADDVAPMTGFTTGREMLQAIAALPKREAWVQQRAEAIVRERDRGDAEELEQLRINVRDGLQTYTEQRMLREMAELGRRTENPADEVSDLGRMVALEQLKKAARLVVDGQGVGRLSSARVLAAERAASKHVREAVAKGQWDKARDWFRQQLLQTFIHRETLKAIEFREGVERLAEKLSATPARARAGKAAPALRDAIDFLLGAVELGPATELDATTLPAAAAALEESGSVPGPWLQALTDTEALRPILQEGAYTNLTVAELRQVDDALRQLQAEVRDRTEVLLGEAKADIEAVEAEIVAEAASTLPKVKPPGTASSDSIGDKMRSKGSALSGYLLNPVDLVRDLTGDNIDSTMFKAIIEPLRAAKAKEAELLKRAIQPVTDAIEAMPAEVKARLRESIDGRALFPGHIAALVPRQRHELLMLALNVGNPGNLQRTCDGRKITVEEVARALDLLTDAELAWVETVWAAESELKKDSFDLEERDTGLRPRGVEAEAFRLPSGRVLRGGYHPAVYDRRASLLGEKQQADTVAGFIDPRYVRPGTAHGHLKARSTAVEDQAISLDVAVIYRHLAQVAHDVAFREAIKSVGRLVLRPAVQQALRERLGYEKANTFLQWLKDSGGASGVQVTDADKMMSVARGAAAHVLLGWRASTAAGDFANLATAPIITKLKTKHLAAALRTFGTDMRRSREEALAASPWLRTMADTTRQQFDKQMKTLLTRQLPGPLQAYKDNAFFLMEAVNYMTATPVWMGAHQQAVEEGRTEEEAVRFADDVLSQVFPSHSPVDQAGILRDRGFWGRYTMFYGYLSTAYRANHRIIAPLFTKEFLERNVVGKVATVGGVAAHAFGFYVAYSVLGELLMGRGPEEGDDDKDDPTPAKRWRNWFLRKLLAGPLSLQPFLPLTAIMESMALGKPAPPSPRGSPMASLADMVARDLWKMADGELESSKRVFAAMKLALEALGFPVTPLDVQARYLFDVTVGDREVTGPADVLSGGMYGERDNQPANIFKPGLE